MSWKCFLSGYWCPDSFEKCWFTSNTFNWLSSIFQNCVSPQHLMHSISGHPSPIVHEREAILVVYQSPVNPKLLGSDIRVIGVVWQHILLVTSTIQKVCEGLCMYVDTVAWIQSVYILKINLKIDAFLASCKFGKLICHVFDKIFNASQLQEKY